MVARPTPDRKVASSNLAGIISFCRDQVFSFAGAAVHSAVFVKEHFSFAFCLFSSFAPPEQIPDTPHYQSPHSLAPSPGDLPDVTTELAEPIQNLANPIQRHQRARNPKPRKPNPELAEPIQTSQTQSGIQNPKVCKCCLKRPFIYRSI